LQPEVTIHEPHLALDGGEDGLNCLRHLIEVAPEYLSPSGLWMVEMMQGQMETVVPLLDHAGYANIQRLRDLEGVDRFAMALTPRNENLIPSIIHPAIEIASTQTKSTYVD
jgi:release factor glutamine methyltransferase